jgi:hypothetical protein
MGEKPRVQSVLAGGTSVFDEMLDKPFIGDYTCLWKAVLAFVDFGGEREREKSRN